jgi:[ribosomal protein S5]-alanine N-acetyltransferase
MSMPVLTTERLTVRPLTSADARDVSDANGEPEPGWLEWTISGYHQLAQLNQPPYGERAIALRDTDQLVGLVGVVPSMGPFAQLPGFEPGSRGRSRFRPEVGLFWALSPAHRGNGYATEAAAAVIAFGFGAMNLRRIVATTTRDNEASMAVMRRLGMTIAANPLPEPEWFQVVGWLDAPPA